MTRLETRRQKAERHQGLHAKVINCFGSVPPCKEISAYIVEAVRGARDGMRSDLIFFGLCEEHAKMVAELVGFLQYDSYVMAPLEEMWELVRIAEEAGFKVS